jgi:hypothetical protein
MADKDSYKAIIDMRPDGRYEWVILGWDNQVVNDRGVRYIRGDREIALIGDEATRTKAKEAARMRLGLLRRYLNRDEPEVITQ